MKGTGGDDQAPEHIRRSVLDEYVQPAEPERKNAGPAPASAGTKYPRQRVIRYLLAGHPVLDVTEMTKDVLGDAFRVAGGSSVLTDGSFVWRLDLASYVEHYGVELPEDFLLRMDEYEYLMPQVERDRLINISMSVSRELGFRQDRGAGPRSRRLQCRYE